MNQDLKPYPKYKDTSLPWLEKIPTQWNIKRGKYVLQCIEERSKTGDEELLTVSSKNGVIPRKSANVTMFKAESYLGYKLCWPGDLVINSLWAWATGLGVSRFHGIISSAYGVYRAKNDQEINSAYLHELVRSLPYQWELQNRSRGIWISRLQMTDEAFLDAPLLIPPLDEQLAIVRFLDYTDRRIKRYIRAKQKLIKLLNEQKQAIIQQAVTRGLDPNVRLKPSNVEWIGMVPEHWEEIPAKYFYKESDKRSITGTEELLSVSHLTGVTPRSQKNITMFLALSNVGHKLCEPGDLVINTMWAWMGALGVTNQAGIVSPSYHVYRPVSVGNYVPEFIDFLLRTQSYISEFICLSTGIRSSRLRLYPEQFLKIPILRPPYSEQLEIIKHIKVKTQTLTETITCYQNEIKLMGEYSSRLFADVVTGKLDVRTAASQLPEEIQEPEVLEEEPAFENADQGEPENDPLEEEAEA